MLQWARAHHCPWMCRRRHTPRMEGTWMCCSGCGSTAARGTGTFACNAAAAGQLEVLQWVRENDTTGEVWNETRVRRNAAGPRKQEVLTWLDQLIAP